MAKRQVEAVAADLSQDLDAFFRQPLVSAKDQGAAAEFSPKAYRSPPVSSKGLAVSWSRTGWIPPERVGVRR